MEHGEEAGDAGDAGDTSSWLGEEDDGMDDDDASVGGDGGE